MTPTRKFSQHAALALEAREEYNERKREAQLERMLLPDAPPRKRQTKRPSPVRQECVMVEVDSGVAGVDKVEHIQTCSVDDIDVVAEFEFAPIAGSTCIGEGEEHFELVSTEWSNNIDFDSDLDMDDDTTALMGEIERNAANEPACESDLTQSQITILQAEDHLNDAALRLIAPPDNDILSFNWTKDRNVFLGKRETFTETTGPTIDIDDTTKPMDIFDKMFDVDFIDTLCRETNRYAAQKLERMRQLKQLTPMSRYKHWSPTNRDEMVCFLVVQMLQGLYILPEEAAYFSFNSFGTMPYFTRIMSYNRFVLLKHMLHFVDNETTTDMSRLWKIRPVIDYFNDKFTSLYKLSQEVAIDESLLKWHGRLSFTQKISTKAAKVGVKTYELCESKSGYLWKFFVYAGKDRPATDNNSARDNANADNFDNADIADRDDNSDNADPANENANRDDRPDSIVPGVERPANATAKIVYDLVEPLLGRGHTLVMDNFYNSPLLLRCLKRQKTDCYGTIRLNREFVPDALKSLSKSELRPGEVVASYCSDLSIMAWRDSNLVSLISTYHNLQIGNREKNNRTDYRPHIVLDYNKNMGGVDKKDQYLSAQPMERVRNRVWYKKLFRRMFNVAVFNCFVLFSSVNRKTSHRQFRTTLAEELLKRHRQIDLRTEPRLFRSRKSAAEGTTKTLSRLAERFPRPLVEANHFPVRTGSKSTVCKLCKSRTIWKCEECNVNLCIERCLKAYHK